MTATVYDPCPTCLHEMSEHRLRFGCIWIAWNGDHWAGCPCQRESASASPEAPPLEAAARRAITALADLACVHGEAFDSNERYGNDCSICAAVRPLVRALADDEEAGR